MAPNTSPHYYNPAGCELVDLLKLYQSDPRFTAVKIIAVDLTH